MSRGVRIALAGGYTAGHAMPMVAVAEAWQARCPAFQPLLIGRPDGPEARIVAAHGLAFRAVGGRPLNGVPGRRSRWAAYAALAAALPRARRLLRRERVALAVGFGGFVSAPVLLAARSLGLPVVLFEANVLPGLANRRFAPWARRLLCAWPETRGYRGWERAAVVGMPLRAAIRALAPGPAGEVEGDRPRRLLVTGGTFGSAFLNREAPAVAGRLAAAGCALEVCHQCGNGDPAAITAAYRGHGVAARVLTFAGDLAPHWRWADAVLCAAGAGTLAEALALGLPGLAVPDTTVADDHQRLNAARLSAAGPLRAIDPRDWKAGGAAALLAPMLGLGRVPPPPADAATALVEQLLPLLPAIIGEGAQAQAAAESTPD